MKFFDWMGLGYDKVPEIGEYISIPSKGYKIGKVTNVKDDRVFYTLSQTGTSHWSRIKNVDVVIKVRVGHPVQDQRKFIGCTAPVTENWKFENGKVVIL